MTQTELENVKIDTIRKGTKKYKIKSYVYFIIVIALLLLVFMVLGRLGNDFTGLMIFIIMMIIPVLVVFRNQLPSIMPDFISDSLFEIDHSQNSNEISAYDLNTKTKEYAKLSGVFIMVIASIVLIADYRNNLGDKMSFYKIMASVLCLIIASIMLTEVTGDDKGISLDIAADRSDG